MIAQPGELLRKYGLAARKQWGQNFLHSVHVLDGIVGAVGRPERIVEIGAGLGTLTARLLQTGAVVDAIERDRDLCEVLRAELGDHAGFRLHEADAVRFNYSVFPDNPCIVGNLPYHLTGPLLFALLEHHAATGPWIVMVQREVADRIRSPPGSRRYGGVSVGLQRVRDVSLVCEAPRGAFVPAPRVDSSVIRFDPRPVPRGEVGSEAGFLELVRRAFQQRRKTLLNALAPLAGRDAARRWCAAAGVDPGLRPEALAPEAFAALQRAREADTHA